MGCSAIEPHTPVLTFDVGHSSSGMRVSRDVGSEPAELLAARRVR